MLLECDAFVVAVGDAGADFGGGLALPGHAISVDAFFGAGGALGAVQALKAAAQAGVAEGAIAAAVAGQLIKDVPDFCGLLVDMNLPGILEVRACELSTRKAWAAAR